MEISQIHCRRSDFYRWISQIRRWKSDFLRWISQIHHCRPMAGMTARTADYLEAIEHLPEGSTLVILQTGWDDYERLLEDSLTGPISASVTIEEDWKSRVQSTRSMG